jgi:hypothetical protein
MSCVSDHHFKMLVALLWVVKIAGECCSYQKRQQTLSLDTCNKQIFGSSMNTYRSNVMWCRGSTGDSSVHHATVYRFCRRLQCPLCHNVLGLQKTSLSPMPQCIGFPGDTNVSTVTPSRGSAGDSSVHYATVYRVCRRHRCLLCHDV